MNCRRVEKLIPLYVEGDLASGLADRITSHIEWCGRCNFLADEYRESQDWLHQCEPPMFEEAALTNMKVEVLKQIESTSEGTSLLASLIQHWGRRQILALSTAVLLVLGMVMVYVYQARGTVSRPAPELVRIPPGEEPSAPENEPRLVGGPEKASEARLARRHRAPRRHSIVRSSYVDPMIAESAVAPVEPHGGTEAGDVLPEHHRNAGSPATLRIEIQTSDPNIRIIWFAPKETDSHQTKPVTD